MATSDLQYRPRLVDGLLDELLAQLSGLLVIGPRGTGKTTTLSRRAKTVVKLDDDARAVAFKADPGGALRDLAEPVLLDEWQEAPGVFGAVRREIDADASPNRFYLTGSVLADFDHDVYPGTGRVQRLAMFPFAVRELVGKLDGSTLFDRLARGEALHAPPDPPDLRGYVELALAGGFPVPALRLTGRPRIAWLQDYTGDLLGHDVDLLEAGRRGPELDRERLRRYFEAYALHSAGVADHKSLYEAAGVRRETGEAYEALLSRLFAIERVPAWSSNRLKRLVQRPKRYVLDAALMSAILGIDEDGILADGNLLGRVIETFVAAQLRPELAVSVTRPRLFHLRTKQGRQEIDLLAELAGRRLIGIEIKSKSAPTTADARHLAWLRDQVGERFLAGVVFHAGPQVFPLSERIVAAPIASLWS